MGKQMSERTIQHAVAEQLNKKYYRRRTAYVSTEAYTKLKRADVILAFMRAPNRPYVVVVEAKSRSTVRQLRLRSQRNGSGLRWLRVAPAVVFSAVLGYTAYRHIWDPIFLLALLGAGNVLLLLVFDALSLRLLKSIPAIEQLGRYPANESWIAVGTDTFLQSKNLNVLRKHCRKNGVGLIQVDPQGRLTFSEIPRPRHTFNDYLSHYGRRSEILATIAHQPKYGPTPPERRQNRRRLASIALLLGITSLLIYLSYGLEAPPPPAEDRPEPVEYATPEDVEIDQGPLDLPSLSDTSPRSPAPPAPDCPPAEPNQPVYYVVDAFLSAEEAEVRLTQLRAAGFRGHDRIPAACFLEGGSTAWAITTGERYLNPAAARRARDSYAELLDQLAAGPSDPTVSSLRR